MDFTYTYEQWIQYIHSHLRYFFTSFQKCPFQKSTTARPITQNRKYCWTLTLALSSATLILLHHVTKVDFRLDQPRFQIANAPVDLSDLKITTNQYHGFHYTILEEDVCYTRNKQTEVFLFIAVCVSAHNFKQRTVIRNTWGTIIHNTNTAKLIFFLGVPNDTNTQKNIIKESLKYQDIVQENFIDSYRNLTLKSISVLRWVSLFCNRTRHVLKVDDDMFVNIPFLLDYLNTSDVHNAIVGQRISFSQPIRNQTSKWYTPEVFFSDKFYPAYTSGTSYVISGDIVDKLYRSSFLEPFFWLEDVYITGLCRIRISADIIDSLYFSCLHPFPNGCSYKHRISGHLNTPEDIVKIWQELNNPYINCTL